MLAMALNRRARSSGSARSSEPAKTLQSLLIEFHVVAQTADSKGAASTEAAQGTVQGCQVLERGDWAVCADDVIEV